MSIYMNFPGAEGGVTAKQFEKWIELTGVHLGMERPPQSRLGTTGYAATGKLEVMPVTVTKHTDGASPNLTVAALQGAFDKTVKIAFTTTTSDGMTNFMSYELSNCGILNATTTGGPDGTPTESYTLSFSKIMFTFNNMDQTGQSSPMITGYDLSTASKA